MRAHLYFYKSMSLFMTHLRCIEPARVHLKSWFGQDPINFFRMSKIFQTFWQIKWKYFECRKKSTFFFIVLKVRNLFDIVSERLNFFEFGVEFLRLHFLMSKFFCRNSCSRNFYAMKRRKNSVVKKSPCRKNSVEINTV